MRTDVRLEAPSYKDCLQSEGVNGNGTFRGAQPPTLTYITRYHGFRNNGVRAALQGGYLSRARRVFIYAPAGVLHCEQ